MNETVRFRLGSFVFTWDPAKYASNVRRHRITFEEAATTWMDRFAIETFDEEHSQSEDRWLRIGMSLRGVILVVWSTDRTRGSDVVIRIIGARVANAEEEKLYEEEG